MYEIPVFLVIFIHLPDLLFVHIMWHESNVCYMHCFLFFFFLTTYNSGQYKVSVAYRLPTVPFTYCTVLLKMPNITVCLEFEMPSKRIID